MSAVPVAAVETQSVSYQLGEFVGVVAIVAVVIGAILYANRRHRADKETARVTQEHRMLEEARLTRPVPGRIIYEDCHSEDLKTPLAQLPDVLMGLQGMSNTTIEVRETGRGILLIGIDRGTATVTWDSLAGSFRYPGRNAGPLTGPSADERYRLSIGDAIAVTQAWVDNNGQFSLWERQEPGPITTN